VTRTRNAELGMRKHKRCSRCGRRRPLAAFGTNARHPSGLQTYCRACMREYSLERRKAGGGGAARARRDGARTCLKCGRNFLSARPKWENRRCPECENLLGHVRQARAYRVTAV
jgi:hypothetical protein